MNRRRFLGTLLAAPIAAAVALRPEQPVMGILRRGTMTFPINTYVTEAAAEAWWRSGGDWKIAYPQLDRVDFDVTTYPGP